MKPIQRGRRTFSGEGGRRGGEELKKGSAEEKEPRSTSVVMLSPTSSLLIRTSHVLRHAGLDATLPPHYVRTCLKQQYGRCEVPEKLNQKLKNTTTSRHPQNEISPGHGRELWSPGKRSSLLRSSSLYIQAHNEQWQHLTHLTFRPCKTEEIKNGLLCDVLTHTAGWMDARTMLSLDTNKPHLPTKETWMQH